MSSTEANNAPGPAPDPDSMDTRKAPEPQPPATAGRMDTSAPSGTGVSRPCR
jgi:hypothetical protein